MLYECILTGYHWDTSDWNPQNCPPLAIAVVPGNEVLDSPASSRHSRDSNLPLDPAEYDATDCNTDYVEEYDSEAPGEYDSEYVGDSEYADNDSDVECGIPESPNFQEILAMQVSHNYLALCCFFCIDIPVGHFPSQN